MSLFLPSCYLHAQGSFPGRVSNYPSNPVRLIIPLPPGGSTDTMARLMADRLAQRLGQPVVAENRVGAGGTVAAALVAKAPPDGYTLLWGNVAPNAILPNLRTLPYDAVKDFAPIAMAVSTPHIILAHPSMPVSSVRDLIALAKSKPGAILYASGGTGNLSHLAGALFGLSARIDIKHLPYPGSAEAVDALSIGEVMLTFTGIPVVLAQIKAGKVKALAVTTPKRSTLLPEIPTAAESGLPGYECSSWNGVLAPAATPKDIVAKLSGVILQVLNAPDVKIKVASLGFEPAARTSEQFADHIKAELATWSKVIAQSGLRAQQ